MKQSKPTAQEIRADLTYQYVQAQDWQKEFDELPVGNERRTELLIRLTHLRRAMASNYDRLFRPEIEK